MLTYYIDTFRNLLPKRRPLRPLPPWHGFGHGCCGTEPIQKKYRQVSLLLYVILFNVYDLQKMFDKRKIKIFYGNRILRMFYKRIFTESIWNIFNILTNKLKNKSNTFLFEEK